MKHRTLCFLMSILLLFPPAIPASATETDGASSGVCGAEGDGSNLTWVLDDDGALTINGTGRMADYDAEESPWYENWDSITSATIGSGVTNVGDNALAGCAVLTSVSLPESVTEIGAFSFSECAALTDIELPDGVTEIGAYAFSMCDTLRRVELPDGVTAINRGLFSYCAALTEVRVPAGVTVIGEFAFYRCAALTDIELPAGIDEIKKGVFQGCASLTALRLPSGVTDVGDDAFSGCGGLTGVSLPAGVTRLGARAFQDCTGLTVIRIPELVTAIGDLAFLGCVRLQAINVDAGNTVYSSRSGVLFSKDGSELLCYPNGKSGAYEVPSGVTGIGGAAFYRCGALTSLRVSDSVTDVGREALRECTGLTSVSLSDQISIIEEGLFQGCSALTDVTIPDGVTRIGENAFRDCSALTSVEIPDSVTSIGDSAFCRCGLLADVRVPEGVTRIGENSFSYCSALTAVKLPDGLTSIGRNAFSECAALTGIRLPDSLTDIGFGAFYRCGALKNVRLPDGMTYLGNSAFSGCGSLTRVSIPDSLGKIDDYAFYNCRALTEARLPEGLTELSKGTFSGCGALTEVTLPRSLTRIGASAFSGCDSLRDIYYAGNAEQWAEIVILDGNDALRTASVHEDYRGPVRIASGFCGGEENGGNLTWTLDSEGTLTIGGVGSMADYENAGAPWYDAWDKLQTVTIDDGVTSIGNSAFSYCSALVSAEIPPSVERIGSCAFYGCLRLTEATIPSGVKSVERDAFKQCKRLTGIRIPDSVTSIDPGAFAACDDLERILVEEGNAAFCDVDGVLFNKEKTVLHSYPKGKQSVYAVPAGVIRVEEAAFQDCYGALTEISFPAGLREIGDSAFDNCTGLSLLKLPYGVESLGRYAFNNCRGLVNLSVPNSVSSIGFGAFLNCIGLTDLTLPSGLSRIESYVFFGCGSLYSVTIPDSLTSVGDSAFKSCGGLEHVFYKGTEEQWKQIQVEAQNEPFIHALLHYISPVPASVYLVSFDPNGGTSVVNEKLVSVGEPYGELPAAIRNQYYFEGWFTERDGGDPVTSDTIVTWEENHTLFAHWSREIGDGTPKVHTENVSVVTKNNAVFSAFITENGEDVLQRFFVYWNKYDPGARYTVEADQEFQAEVHNLSPDSEYFVYAKAVNASGEGIGEVVTFRTQLTDRPQSISVTPTYLALTPSDRCCLLATVLPVSADNRTVVWSSSDPDVARVDGNGTVTAVSLGSAVITVTTEVDRLTASCTVSVNENVIAGSFDFSEWNMVTNTSSADPEGFQYDTATAGGNFVIGTAYLARWDGAVLEEHDPYQSKSANSRELYREVDADYHVQEVLWLPARTNAFDNNEIKAAIMKYGAVYMSFIANNACYDSTGKSYYYPYYPLLAQDANSGHAVAVVGWNDFYSRENFNVNAMPPGDGAFLCKNSYGEEEGDNGYFYVSYYDSYFGRKDDFGKKVNVGGAVVSSVERKTNYNTIYQYDPLGPCDVTSAKGSLCTANVFPRRGEALERDEDLRAVSFYTAEKNMQYEIYAVPDYQTKETLNNKGPVLAAGTMEEMGYHTVVLDKPVALQAGTRFAVIVMQRSMQEKTVVYYEYPTDKNANPYSNNASAGPEESFYKMDNKDWKDLTEARANANFCVKAFTDNGGAAQSGRIYYGVSESPSAEDAAGAWEGSPAELLEEQEEDDLIWGELPVAIPIGDNIISFVEGALLPGRYDLREESCVSPVRNQGAWGSCWAHAMYASLESCLLKKAKTLAPITAGDGSRDDEYLALTTQYGVAISRLTLEETLHMAKGSEYRLSPSVYPANATETGLLWSSDDLGVATVNTNGVVTARNLGQTRITVTTADGVLGATCLVTVGEGAAVRGVALDSQAHVVGVGDVFLLDYAVDPPNSANREVLWTSSNASIVSVNENGKLEALSKGTAEITVTTKDGGYTDTVVVTVSDLPTLDVPMRFRGLSPSLQPWGNDLVGTVAIQIENRTGVPRELALLLAVYDEKGQMTRVFTLQTNTAAGQSSHSMDVAIPSEVPGKTHIVRCFALDPSSSVPLAYSSKVVIG